MNSKMQIVEAYNKRQQEFLPEYSDVLRRVLQQHPVLAGPFKGRTSSFAMLSYEMFSWYVGVGGKRCVSDVRCWFSNLMLLQEEFKILGFDHAWLDALSYRVAAQHQRKMTALRDQLVMEGDAAMALVCCNYIAVVETQLQEHAPFVLSFHVLSFFCCFSKDVCIGHCPLAMTV